MNCPACGNANAEEAAFCGVCYEVLGKKKAPAASPVAPPAAPPRPAASPRLSPANAAALAVVFAVFVLTRGWIARVTWILDGVNLGFHESGHLIFGVLGLGDRFIMVAGGTAMQLILPTAAALHFRARGETASAFVALFWVGQNFLGIGKYVADARAQRLELVAGGVHDWTYLLERTGLLTHDAGLGRAVEVLGCFVMAFAVVGAVTARMSRRFPTETTLS